MTTIFLKWKGSERRNAQWYNSRSRIQDHRISTASDDLIDLVDPFIGTEPVGPSSTNRNSGNMVLAKTTHWKHSPGCMSSFWDGFSNALQRWVSDWLWMLWQVSSRVSTAIHARIAGVWALRTFQQTGVGAIRKYYNYCRVTPFTEECGGLSSVGMPFSDHERGGYAWFLCMRHSALMVFVLRSR